MRPSGRRADELREITLEPGFSKHAEGSCMARFGDTHVLCTASVDERVPPWLRNSGRGWVTAEYGMLPRSTNTRTAREAARGRQGGRTLEIQRLIGRSLRAAVDLKLLGERTVTLDCDVLQADGGTRTAAITGGWIALADALDVASDGERILCAGIGSGATAALLTAGKNLYKIRRKGLKVRDLIAGGKVVDYITYLKHRRMLSSRFGGAG